MTGFARTVERALVRLAPDVSCVLVATSGGPDSQVLLHVLAQLRDRHAFTLHACGVDHGLRAEAAAELDLAQALATSLGVPFHRRRVTLSERGNVLTEARRERYRGLHELAGELGATAIAVAHTASDQLETYLLGLARSRGRPPMGMPARRGAILRPMLELTRAEVLDYAQCHALPYASDPSNVDMRRARSRIRSRVVPELLALNPSLERHIGRLCASAAADADYLGQRAASVLERHGGPSSISLAALQALHPALRSHTLDLWLRRLGVLPSVRLTRRLEKAALRGYGRLAADDARFSIGNGYLVGVRGSLTPGPLTTSGFEVAPLGMRLCARLDAGRPAESLTRVANDTWRVALDADQLQLGLNVRASRTGERLAPWGLEGTVKIADLYKNHRVPQPLRAAWPVVCLGDEPVWVVGLRRGRAAPISEATRSVVQVSATFASGVGACYSDSLSVQHQGRESRSRCAPVS